MSPSSTTPEPTAPEPMPDERLEEWRDLMVDAASAGAPYNPDVNRLDTARIELVAEVDRLRAWLAARPDRAAVLDEAAEEIDRLRAERDRFRSAWHSARGRLRARATTARSSAPGAQTGGEAEPPCRCGHPADAHGEQCSLCTVNDDWFHPYTPTAPQTGGEES